MNTVQSSSVVKITDIRNNIPKAIFLELVFDAPSLWELVASIKIELEFLIVMNQEGGGG